MNERLFDHLEPTMRSRRPQRRTRGLGRDAPDDLDERLAAAVHLELPGDHAMRVFLATALSNAGQVREAVASLLELLVARAPTPGIDRYRRALSE
jgi:thioredoxin-like negative regulator of GroEL